MARIKDVFAANLKRVLAGRGALARLEAGSGVNRVQLYRYLNGTIPNEVNLRRISAALNMEESDFFQVDYDGRDHGQVARSSKIRPKVWNVEKSYSLKVYFAVPGAADYVIVAIINVFAFEEIVRFVRYTGFAVGGAKEGDKDVHVHAGAVKALGSYAFFQGERVDTDGEPSLLYIAGTGTGRDVHEGAALVMSPQGPSFVRIVAKRTIGPIAETDVGRLVGAFPSADPCVEWGLFKLLREELPVHLAVT